MRYALVLVLGILAGWFGHAAVYRRPPPARAEPPQKIVPPAPPLVASEPAPLPRAPTPPAVEEKAPAEEEAAAPEAKDPELDRMREMIQSQSKMWRGFAGMQAKQKAEALLASLPFDAQREKRILDILQQEAELQAEHAAAMMLGDEEMDPAAFQWFMGMPEDLSPRVEAELATFMSDGEIQVVRDEVKRSHDKQMSDLADMQIGMMQIHDLSDDQRTRMRDVFSGKDMMTERFTQFADVARDRQRMARLLRGEGLKEEMEKSLAPTRQRVRAILNDEQFVRYEAFEKQMVRQSEMALKMMSSFLGPSREGTQPPASR